MWWLAVRITRHAPRRLFLAAVAVAFPVAVLASTLLYIDHSVHAMTRQSLEPVQVEMRALATSLDVNMTAVERKLQTVPGVTHVDPFGAADVLVGAPGVPGRVPARLFAVRPTYLRDHPWVHAAGDLRRGVLLNRAVAQAPGFSQAHVLSIDLRRGGAAPLHLSIPVAGRADVRAATAWFEIPAGDVQGDVAAVPRAVLIDYGTFERQVLPALRRTFGGPAAVTNPGLSDLPPASLEAHVSVDHRAYPSDPARAAGWSSTMRRVLERRAPGAVVVADNTNERLTEAAGDATAAKLIFFLLGVPGALVAAALGLAAASALADAHRREDALLRTRGASDGQLVQLAIGQGVLAGVVGVALGLVIATGVVSLVNRQAAWRDIPASRLIFISFVAVFGGAITTAARLVPIVRAGRRSSLVGDRRQLTGPWQPAWRRAHLDVVFLGIGLAILVGNILTGGLKLPRLDTDHQSQTLALAFYVLLAPIALWIGATLLVIRGFLALLVRRAQPDRPRPLSSWRSAGVRWFARRPARTVVALTLGALAVAFGVQVVVFTATYRSAKQADTRAALGADLRLLPATDRQQPPPQLRALAATTPIRSIPGRAGSDRKTIMAVDPGTYDTAVIAQPRIVSGRGVEGLAKDPLGVVVSEEVAQGFAVKPGDTLPVTTFPDDPRLARKVDLHVVGVFRSFPPDDPFSEMVVGIAAVPKPVPPPDFYLARVAHGHSPPQVAARLNASEGGSPPYAATTIGDLARQQERSLAALNLDGLGRIEAAAAATIAGVGVGVLGAFIVLDRRRELAVLRMLGATDAQLLSAPIFEASVAAIGSLLIGVPLGIGLAMLAIRVLSLFFTLPPPLVHLPVGGLLGVVGSVLVVSAIAVAFSLRRVTRVEAAPLLREP